MQKRKQNSVRPARFLQAARRSYSPAEKARRAELRVQEAERRRLARGRSDAGPEAQDVYKLYIHMYIHTWL